MTLLENFGKRNFFTVIELFNKLSQASFAFELTEKDEQGFLELLILGQSCWTQRF